MTPKEPDETAGFDLRIFSASNPKDPKVGSWITERLREREQHPASEIIFGKWESPERQEMEDRGRRVNLGAQLPAQTEEAVPRCRKHDKFMKYNPAEDQMECQVSGCKVVARKNRTFRDSAGAEPGRPPAVYRGPLQFVTDDEGELYLYLADSNAMISLAGIEHSRPFENDVAANRKQLSFLSALTSMVPQAEQESAAIRRRVQQAAEIDALNERQKERLGEAHRRGQGGDAQRFKNGWTTLHGVWIPPHLASSTTLSQIKGSVHARIKTNKFADAGRTVTAVLMDFEESSRTVSSLVRIYSARGDSRGTFTKNKSVTDYITNVEHVDSRNPLEAPHYIMYDGAALTIDDLKQIGRRTDWTG